jgi:hypothetical protein
VYISLAFTETNGAIAVITNLFKQFIDLVNQYPNGEIRGRGRMGHRYFLVEFNQKC